MKIIQTCTYFLIIFAGLPSLTFGQSDSAGSLGTSLQIQELEDGLDALYNQIQQIQLQFQQERQTLRNENQSLQEENVRLQAVILSQQQELDDANAKLRVGEVRLNKTSLKEDQRDRLHNEYLRRIEAYCGTAWSLSDIAQCSSDEGRYEYYDKSIKGTP